MSGRNRCIALAMVMAMATGCTMGGALSGIGQPTPGASAPGVIYPTGPALEVRKEYVETKAKAWQSDAVLIGLRGQEINGAGTNFSNSAKWIYTYRSLKAKATASFTVTNSGVTGPVAGPDQAAAKALTDVGYDSDDAVLRYKTTVKDQNLDRFNLQLALGASGAPTWQIETIDEFGKSQDQGSVNASTGSVTLS